MRLGFSVPASIVFLGASIACASAGSLSFLIGARCVQGVGAALLLAGSLPVLAALTGSSAKGAGLWTLAGTFGLALGPALGGVPDPGVRLARHLHRPGPCGRARAAGHDSRPSPRGRPGGLASVARALAAGESLPRAPLRCARGGALPGRPARDHGLGLLADRGCRARELAPGRRPGRPAAGAAAAACRRGLGRCRPARRWPGRPGLAAVGKRRACRLGARALRGRARARGAAALAGRARPRTLAWRAAGPSPSAYAISASYWHWPRSPRCSPPRCRTRATRRC